MVLLTARAQRVVPATPMPGRRVMPVSEAVPAPARVMAGHYPGRCPATFEARLIWLARCWAEEPVPTSMHAVDGVFFGPPDRENTPGPARLGAARSTADELVGGSKLGSPRILPAFERYIERSETETDSDGFYRRPLAAALSQMARGGSRRRPRKLGAGTIWAILRSGGDWHAVATRGKWPLEMFADYLSASIAELFDLYEQRRTA